MVQALPKSKVVYHDTNLSALAIFNLTQAIESSVTVVKAPKPNTDRHEFFHVELKIGEQIINGELSIMDFITFEKNRESKDTPSFYLQGSANSIVFDDWVGVLNRRLRPAVTSMAIAKDGSDVKEIIKAIAKALEEQKVLDMLAEEGSDKRNAYLASLVYSYLEPASKLINKKVQSSLKAISTKYGFIDFNAFVKGAAAGGAIKAKAGTTISSSNAKIRRDNTGTILPQAGKRNILITSALPYVNNVPHLGNIIGCVLSADVYARYCRLAGHNTLYVCGTDEYGTATETKARQEGKTPQQICDHYHALHAKIYEWFDCDFDKFGRTTTPKQTEITQDIFQHLLEQGNTYEDAIDQQYCESCATPLADRMVRGGCPNEGCGFADAKGDQCDGCGKLVNAVELIEPKCTTCNSTPVIKTSEHIFINLTKIQPELQAWVQEQSAKGAWSSNSISFTNTMLQKGLLGRCITRDLKWGTPVPVEKFKEKVFYVWFDAPIGYISITANYTDDWKQWWQNQENVELYQFMGKDNITFHTVIFPSTLIGSGQPWTKLHHISTTEFLNYEKDADGIPLKFSKTRNIGVFGDDAMNSGIPSEVWRYFLLSNRPENQDTVFMWNDFVAKNNNELLANLGNFSNRALKFTAAAFDGKVPDYPGMFEAADGTFFNGLNAKIVTYMEQMEAVKLKDGLKTAMEYSSDCNGYFQQFKPWDLNKKDDTKDRCKQVVNTALNALFGLCVLLEPFMPSFSAKVYEQLGITERTEAHAVMLQNLSRDPTVLRNLVTGGQPIGNPEPIFREIKPEEAVQWKEKFSGARSK